VSTGESRPEAPRLTRRERDVLVELCRPLVASGEAFTEPASIRQVAEALFVSEAAVKQHLLRLYDKFAIFDDDAGRRRVQLANAAIDRGVLTRADLLGDGTAEPSAGDAVAAAHDAFGRGDFGAACDALVAVEAAGGELDVAALELLGESALFSDRHAESIEARQRAHARYLEAGDRPGAARAALGLAVNHAARLAPSVAGGWLNTARRHLDGLDAGPEHGYLAATTALFELYGGDADGGRDHAREAYAFGERFDDADLRALGLAFEGVALTRLGDIDRGLALLDEAMAGAAAGTLGPLTLGIVYCRTVCTCLDVFDYGRAREWIEVIEATAPTIGSNGFPGDCRAHRAAVLIARGDWAAGEEEARHACEESARFDLAHTGLATYTMAEVALRHGSLDEAEAGFQRAHGLGANPHPGLALVWLARGDTEDAWSTIATALHEAGADPLARARLLPTYVDVAIACDQLTEGREAASELGRIADQYATTALRAAAATALGAVRLASDEADASASHLAHAKRLWRECDVPYEAARTGVHLGAAHLALGDRAGAAVELEAAQREFEHLGAGPDAARAAALLAATQS
jgi:DNA-binding CsgD family transcriptional regulator